MERRVCRSRQVEGEGKDSCTPFVDLVRSACGFLSVGCSPVRTDQCSGFLGSDPAILSGNEPRTLFSCWTEISRPSHQPQVAKRQQMSQEPVIPDDWEEWHSTHPDSPENRPESNVTPLYHTWRDCAVSLNLSPQYLRKGRGQGREHCPRCMDRRPLFPPAG